MENRVARTLGEVPQGQVGQRPPGQLPPQRSAWTARAMMATTVRMRRVRDILEKGEPKFGGHTVGYNHIEIKKNEVR